MKEKITLQRRVAEIKMEKKDVVMIRYKYTFDSLKSLFCSKKSAKIKLKNTNRTPLLISGLNSPVTVFKTIPLKPGSNRFINSLLALI